jgi:hypothetical protein
MPRKKRGGGGAFDLSKFIGQSQQTLNQLKPLYKQLKPFGQQIKQNGMITPQAQAQILDQLKAQGQAIAELQAAQKMINPQAQALTFEQQQKALASMSPEQLAAAVMPGGNKSKKRNYRKRTLRKRSLTRKRSLRKRSLTRKRNYRKHSLTRKRTSRKRSLTRKRTRKRSVRKRLQKGG